MISDDRINEILAMRPVDIGMLAKLTCIIRTRDIQARTTGNSILLNTCFGLLHDTILEKADNGEYISASFCHLVFARNKETKEIKLLYPYQFGEPERIFPGLTEENFDEYPVTIELLPIEKVNSVRQQVIDKFKESES